MDRKQLRIVLENAYEELSGRPLSEAKISVWTALVGLELIEAIDKHAESARRLQAPIEQHLADIADSIVANVVTEKK